MVSVLISAPGLKLEEFIQQKEAISPPLTLHQSTKPI